MVHGLFHRDALLFLFSAYCAASRRSPARVSTLIWNHGARHRQIRDGADLRTRTFERALRWFSDHWPEDLHWPEEISRPQTAQRAQAIQPPTNTGADLPILGRDSALAQAMTLGDDGRLRSPAALCKALRIRRTTYDYVVRRYADGRDRADEFPRRGTWTRRLLDHLVESGDGRFAVRRARLDKAAAAARRHDFGQLDGWEHRGTKPVVRKSDAV